MPNEWVLKTTDDYDLRTPDGVAVRLPYRNVRELLGILAVAPERSASRKELAAMLWPHLSDNSRQVNLRQAIYRLRQAIGDEAVVANRENVLLANSFKLSHDYPSAKPVGHSDVPPSESTPMAGFVQLLRWCAERDPAQMLDLMRTNMDLSLGIWPIDLRQLIDTATKRLKIGHRLQAWVPFWRAYERHIGEDILGARDLFALAAKQAIEEKDQVLAMEALIWLGASDVLLKHLDSAHKIADHGAHIAYHLTDHALKARIEHLRGTILIHQNHTQEGLKLLEEAATASENRLLDLAQNEALRSLYHACAGQSSAAVRLLDSPRRIALETRHFRLESICGLAEGYVALAEGDPAAAINRLDQVVTRSAEGNEKHCAIYAREATSVAFWQLGEKAAAIEQIEATKNLRRALNMAYTDWDRMRLRPLQSGT